MKNQLEFFAASSYIKKAIIVYLIMTLDGLIELSEKVMRVAQIAARASNRRLIVLLLD